MVSFRSALLAVLLAFSLLLLGCDDDTVSDMNGGDQPTTFTVTIENTGGVFPINTVGAFTPDDVIDESANNVPPLQPGEAFQFSFIAGPTEVPNAGTAFSFAAMFIQSNDLYYAFGPGGVPLFESDGTPIGLNSAANLTDQVGVYDAGTEVDETPGSGPNQAPRQSGLDTGTEENGVVTLLTDTDSDGMLDNDGFSYPLADETIDVSVSSEADDASGAFRFTVTIRNVGSATQINGEPALISPGSYAVHYDQAMGNDVTFPGHTPGEEASGGIEAIAEDGRPGGAVSGDTGTPAGNHIEELTPLTGVTVPLSPGAYAVHSDAVQLFATGDPASAGIEDIAEDGVAGTLADALSQLGDVSDSGAFDTPDGASEAGPIAPTPNDANNSYSFTVEASPGDRLSFATMYIQSNDFFYGFAPEGLPLFSGDQPVSGDVTGQVALYDAGTEVDEAPGAGLTQIIRSGLDTGTDENGSVVLVSDTDDDDFLDDDGFNYAQTPNVIRVTITPQQN